jgi:hypothetical protein
MVNFMKKIFIHILQFHLTRHLKIIYISHHIYTYIYENSIPKKIYGDSDGLKKYVQENKSLSEYSLKKLYINKVEYNNMNKCYSIYVMKDNKIHIIPFGQYREMQKQWKQ